MFRSISDTRESRTESTWEEEEEGRERLAQMFESADAVSPTSAPNSKASQTNATWGGFFFTQPSYPKITFHLLETNNK